MPPTLEALARQQIDASSSQLAGLFQNSKAVDGSAGRGIALRLRIFS